MIGPSCFSIANAISPSLFIKCEMKMLFVGSIMIEVEGTGTNFVNIYCIPTCYDLTVYAILNPKNRERLCIDSKDRAKIQ